MAQPLRTTIAPLFTCLALMSACDPRALFEGRSVAARDYTWFQARPMLTDANRDGVEDIIGLVSYTSGAELRVGLTAFSGQDWKVLWESESAVDQTALDHLRIFHAAGSDQVLLVSGTLIASHAAADGSLTWRRDLGSKLETIEQAGETLRLALQDDRVVWIRPTDGAETPAAELSQATAPLADGHYAYYIRSAYPPRFAH